MCSPRVPRSVVLPFVEYGELDQAFLDAVRQAVAKGGTADKAAASLTLPDKFKDYNMGRAKNNVAAIVDERQDAGQEQR